MTDCADPNCVHCAISELLLQRQPISTNDACAIGQVVADIIASIPATVRAAHGAYVKGEVVKMLDEAIAGTWAGEPPPRKV